MRRLSAVFGTALLVAVSLRSNADEHR